MYRKKHHKVTDDRLKIICILIIILFFMMTLRLFNVQVINNKYYVSKLKDKTDVLIYGSTAPRGRIYDRNGILIVDNEPNKGVACNENAGKYEKGSKRFLQPAVEKIGENIGDIQAAAVK